ncbi:redoxin family protein [Streptomyces sp. 8N616]|uniref:redoxin family protein n=1 Tax=Streptomyces sp. 8N616 TaxID=3457414 RepID=UPI003FD67FD1
MRTRRRRAPVLVAALLAATALAVAGCGMDSGGGTAAPGTGARADAADAGDAGDAGGVGEPLRFSGTTLEGKPFDGAKLAGKPAVLWFWAPWCGTCRGQAPQAAKLAKTYEGRVNVVGVAGLDKPGPMRSFVSSRKVGGFPHLNDEQGSIWRKFEISQQSSFVLLDKDGKVVHSGVPSGPEELDSRVAKLVG